MSRQGHEMTLGGRQISFLKTTRKTHWHGQGPMDIRGKDRILSNPPTDWSISMRHLRLSLAAIVVAFSISAHASQSLDIDKVVTQQREIRADLITGTGYEQMPPSKREEIVKKQDDLLRMLEGRESSDELSEDQKAAVLNSLESIEATISNATAASSEGERKVCKRERTLGSNRMTRVCRTEAQMAAERERAREQLDRDPQLTR